MLITAVLGDPAMLAAPVQAVAGADGGVLELVRNTTQDAKELFVLMGGAGAIAYVVVKALKAGLAVGAVLTALAAGGLFVWGVSHMTDVSKLWGEEIQQQKQGAPAGGRLGEDVVAAVADGLPGYTVLGLAANRSVWT